MHKKISVRIRRDTWPRDVAVPASFPYSVSDETINIHELFLMLAHLTAPPGHAGLTINDYWAWLRYYQACAEGDNLLVTEEYSQVDSHQKTILSDDWGMSIPIYWLWQKLNGHAICDGKYFIDRIAHLHKVITIGKKKRGPQKSPDFVMLDAHGEWHVIECKGTQTSLKYLDGQLGDGVSQKSTLVFPSSWSGQRLVAGVFIGTEGEAEQSRLEVIDPVETDKDFRLTEQDMESATEPLQRYQVAKFLRLVDQTAASLTTLNPNGLHLIPRAQRKGAQAKEEILGRNEEIMDSLRNYEAMGIVYADGRTEVRRSIVELAVPLKMGGGTFDAAVIERHIDLDFLSELAMSSVFFDEGLIDENSWLERVMGIKLAPMEDGASYSIGDVYKMTVQLIRQ